MKKCPYCVKKFYTWKSVRGHVASCIKSNQEFVITEEYGALHYTEFLKDKYYINSTYPKIKNINNITKTLKRKGLKPTNLSVISDNNILYTYLNTWIDMYGTLPSSREWYNSTFPKPRQIIVKFGSWNNFISSAGFEPNIQNGFGIDTYGLDKHLYRSQAEAYFSDNFL